MPNTAASTARVERFWLKVDRSGGPESCWPWLGAKKQGYGRFDDVPVHRFAFELAGGHIAEGMQLHHQCQNRACVNLAHLVPMTHAQHRAEHAALRARGERKVFPVSARVRAEQRAYRASRIEKGREYMRAYRKAKPEKVREANRVYCAGNLEKVREARRAYHAAHREKLREANRVWRVANREKVREANRAYRAAHREALNEYGRAWRAAKKGKKAAPPLT